MSINNKIIYVVGPTASGKTALSIELSKRFNGEVISADSMQVYKGIHIASAAPNELEKCGIAHHLLEFRDIDDQFTVADYVKLARDNIADILSRGKIPVICGGTGLYIDSLINNTQYPEQKTDLELRKKLEKDFDELGADKMLNILSEFDKDSAIKLHPNNRRRIIRAFEVYKITGKTITEQNILSNKNPTNYSNFILGINFKNRDILYERIDKRIDIMIKSGLVEEAKQTYLTKDKCGAYQAIGHKEFYRYFDNKCSFDEAIEDLKKQTRHYAKRQLTWFNKNKDIIWFYPDEDKNYIENTISITEDFLRSN